MYICLVIAVKNEAIVVTSIRCVFERYFVRSAQSVIRLILYQCRFHATHSPYPFKGSCNTVVFATVINNNDLFKKPSCVGVKLCEHACNLPLTIVHWNKNHDLVTHHPPQTNDG